MKIAILKDATLTVTAGQTVEVSPEQAALAIRLGFAEECHAAEEPIEEPVEEPIEEPVEEPIEQPAEKPEKKAKKK